MLGTIAIVQLFKKLDHLKFEVQKVSIWEVSGFCRVGFQIPTLLGDLPNYNKFRLQIIYLFWGQYA